MNKINYLTVIFSIFMIMSCGKQEPEKHFWIKVSILKELGYANLSVNDVSIEENETLMNEYLREKDYDRFYFENRIETFDMFFIKLPIDTSLKDLDSFDINIKSNEDLIWSGMAYDEDDLSECGFYKVKNQPHNNDVKDLSIYGLKKNEDNFLIDIDRSYLFENKNVCQYEDKNSDKVMIAVNIANNTFDNDPIIKINNIDVNNGVENNYYWNHFRRILEGSGLSALYLYIENNDGFGKESSYWSLLIDRSELKNYKLEFLSQSGKKAIQNLNEIEFCGVPDEKSFDELSSELKVLTYAFTIKDGNPRLDFQGALDKKNQMPNCSKEDGTTSGLVLSTYKLKQDRTGDVTITRCNDNTNNYSFTDIETDLLYSNISSDPDEYKKTGFKRWFFKIATHFHSATKDGFWLTIPFFLLKEGESLTINSNMIKEQDENEKSFFSGLLTPLYFSENDPILFTSSGSPIIEYGNYQEISYNVKSLPKKYGDYLELDFNFLAKQDENTILVYEGNIKTRFLGEDIFHCFNEDKLWVCPLNGFEENHPWIE